MQTSPVTSVGAVQELSRVERGIVMVTLLPIALTFATMTPVLHKIEVALATGPDEAVLVRVALTIVGLSMAFGAPAAGWLIDWIGVRKPLIAATAIWITAGSLNFFVTDLRILILSRLFEGLAAAATVIIGAMLIGKLSDGPARSRLAGMQVTVSMACSMALHPLAGVLGDMDWRYPFLLHLITLPLLFAAFGLKDSRPEKLSPTESVDAKPWYDNFPFHLVIISFLAGLVMYSATTYMPYRFRDVGASSATLVGVALMAENVAIMVCAGFFGSLRRRISSTAAFKFSFVIAAAGAVLAATMPHFLLVMGALLVFGVGVSCIGPNIMSLVAATPKPRRGRVAGIVKGCSYGAALVGALVFEPAMRLGGSSAVMLSVGGVSLLIALGFMIAERRQRLMPGVSQEATH